MSEPLSVTQKLGCDKHAIVERMDIIIAPSDWSYGDRQVPSQVT
jgi:hypothetical protein